MILIYVIYMDIQWHYIKQKMELYLTKSGIIIDLLGLNILILYVIRLFITV